MIMHPPLFLNSIAFVNIARLCASLCGDASSNLQTATLFNSVPSCTLCYTLLSVVTLLRICTSCLHTPLCLQTPPTPGNSLHSLPLTPTHLSNTPDPRYGWVSNSRVVKWEANDERARFAQGAKKDAFKRALVDAVKAYVDLPLVHTHTHPHTHTHTHTQVCQQRCECEHRIASSRNAPTLTRVAFANTCARPRGHTRRTHTPWR
jgi:hypothetical protein